MLKEEPSLNIFFYKIDNKILYRRAATGAAIFPTRYFLATHF